MLLLLLLFVLVILALWVAIGCAIFYLSPKKAGRAYCREVAKRLYCQGESIAVNLTMIPQAPVRPIEDRDVVLAIDRSSSMGMGPGSPLRESVRAAENFVRSLSERLAVGIVAFDEQADVLCPPGTGKDRALRALRAIRGGGGTRIDLALDACREALREGRTEVDKTIILLSDGGSALDEARRAAERIAAEFANVTILCIGFGSAIDEEVMKALATSPDHYIHIKEVKHISEVFGTLAAVVSGQAMTSAVINEGVWAPRPFRLQSIGGLHPTDVIGTRPTRVEWAAPVMAASPMRVSYNLLPECPGWHDVASPDGRVIWQTPEEQELIMPGPAGPKVLIVSWWMRWAWWLFNPLFWMLFGRFWQCEAAAAPAEDAPVDQPLAVPSLPALPTAPTAPPYSLQVRPALVIGIGEVGEWTACRLKARLLDRGVDRKRVEIVALRVTHAVNFPAIVAAGVRLEGEERIDLHQDLRPYLESLRTARVPPTRVWVPWREWLGESLPQNTSHSVDGDRRKARLALLRKPETVEQRLRPALKRLIDKADATVVVVGSADDAEFSGLVAEVAHICAAAGVGVNAVFAPRLNDRAADASLMALTEEIQRMVLMSGSLIMSDRYDPPVSAKQLFERLIVIEQTEPDVSQASVPAAELIWNALAFDEVFKRIPLVRQQDQQILCCGAVIDGRGLPDNALWEWARETFLAERINHQYLKLVTQENRVLVSLPSKEEVDRATEEFWTARGMGRLPNVLLTRLRQQTGGEAWRAPALLALVPRELSGDPLYHEQVAYAQKDRYRFVRYMEEWCFNLLERERAQGGWGLALLMKALMKIEEDFQHALITLGQDADDNQADLLYGIYAEYAQVVSSLREDVGKWLAHLAGAQMEFKMEPLSDELMPLSYEIEANRHSARRRLDSMDESYRQVIASAYQHWVSNDGDAIMNQIRFAVRVTSDARRLDLILKLGDRQEVRAGSPPGAAIRDFFDRYRLVVAEWPTEQAIRPMAAADPSFQFMIGRHAARAYPQMSGAPLADDPLTTAAIGFRSIRFVDALEAHQLRGERQYAWPEEANAARIAQKIRNRLQREPRPFTPLTVHFMRDTHKLFSFLSDLGRGKVHSEGGQFILRRNGEAYDIGPDNGLTGIQAFQAVIHQVVSLECSVAGKSINQTRSDWAIGPEEAVRAIERHPLAHAALSSPDWPIWQDIIRGLALEQSLEDGAAGASLK